MTVAPRPAACAHEGVAVARRVDQVVKSAGDQRLYRGLELNNGLRVLLVSDRDADKAAASLDVNVGYLMDPTELPGLAHFCEHMLFLGTQKYPSENEYQRFVQSHGGSANAYTSGDHTNYHFDVAPEHLQPTVDRFAQFFLAPLFTESATEREVNAVDSENQNNLQNDSWRLAQLERSLSDPTHDYFKFGTGNRKTLSDEPKGRGVDVREQLLTFHKQQYSANLMCLALVGKDSLDEMESQLVLPYFCDVDDKGRERKEWLDHPYGADQRGHRIEVVPVKDLRGLHISFPIPDLTPHYRSKPGHYLAHLIGHEGPGSLLSELKRRGWVNSLHAGARSGARGFAFFSVDVDLSEDGLKHADDVVLLIFEYIGLLRREGAKEWIFGECQQLEELKFRFKDKERSMGYARYLASSMQYFPLEQVLSAPHTMDQFKPDLIEMVLSKLEPPDMLYVVMSRDFADRPANVKEKWYGTEYRKERFDEEFLNKCRAALQATPPYFKLPLVNEFIPTNFDLYPRQESVGDAHPRIIRDDKFSRLWFKQDDEFLLPKCCSIVELRSPVLYSDPLRTNLTSMLVSCFEDALTEYTYNADLAGLSYSFSACKYGLTLQAAGYNEKQRLFVKRLAELLAAFEPDAARFEVLKEVYVRHLRNFAQEQPYTHASYHSMSLLAERFWSKEQLLSSVDEVTVDSLKTFLKDIFSAVYIEALVHGNSTEEEARSLVDDVLGALKKDRNVRSLFSNQMCRDREVQLPQGCSYVFEAENRTHSNSAMEVLLQTGVQGTRANVMLELLSQIVAEPAFDTLRTKEQLGYIVFAGCRRSNGTQGMRFIVQGEKDPQFAESRVEAFLVDMRVAVEQMSDEEFARHREALAVRRLERPKRLSALANRFWSEIVTAQYNFGRELVEVAELRTIDKAALLDFFDGAISAKASDRKKLAVHVRSQAASESRDGAGDASITKAELIDSANLFKQRMQLYPLPPPFLPIPPCGAVNDADAKSML